MPEFKIEGGKGPFQAFDGQTGLHMGIFGRILMVVEINKLMAYHLPVDEDGSDD